MPKKNTPLEWLALHSLFLYKPHKGHELRGNFDSLYHKVDFKKLESLLTHWVSFESDQYPEMLRHIPDAPLGFFYRGLSATILTERPWIGIVGARKATEYGRKQAFVLAKELSAMGFGIISGLAYGVDGAAHRGALEGGGVTVGVMGTGLDQIYPPEHQGLAEQMMQQGGLLTEFFPGTAPHSHHFPQRNRLISGLSIGVVIVEAAEKSGSLITARLAAEQGKEVFVVPGQTGLHTKGSNRLIKQGAKLVEGVEDILEELPLHLNFPRGPEKKSASFEDQLLEKIKGPITAEVLAKQLGVPIAETLVGLTKLECAGKAKKLAGNRYDKITRGEVTRHC